MAASRTDATLQFIRKLRARGGDGLLGDGQLLERFVSGGDALAFEALVHRHGGMVLGLCRRMLGNADDADDAFQATFLLLARKARGICKADSVACWLHGVAYRVASKARAARSRRRLAEARVRSAGVVFSEDAAAGAELRSLLDDELARLPERYRCPLVLCYLQGRTGEAAARELGWAVGTLWGRLARARDLLRRRLARRGLLIPAAALTGALLAQGATAAVPIRFVAEAVGGAVGPGSAAAIALAKGAMRAMFLAKLQTAVGAIVAVGLVIVGGWLAYPDEPSAVAQSAQPAPKGDRRPAPIPPFDGKLLTRGQKATPDGGKAVLYSRNRHGNYPVASYCFGRGLRGDDADVANEVELVFGNRVRENAFAGAAVDSVPGATRASAGAVGRDGENAGQDPFDEFRVSLYGGCDHRIADLGKVDYARAAIPAALVEVPADGERSEDTAKVVAGHVYVIHISTRQADPAVDRYVKLRVLRHQDNDAVEFEWATLPAPKRKDSVRDP